MPSTQEPQKNPTELENVLSLLSSQNNRFVNLLSQLDDIGHKGKNTRVPTEDAKKINPTSDGLFNDIYLQLDYMSHHNNTLECLVVKLSSLI